jgi:hypothetical protein
MITDLKIFKNAPEIKYASKLYRSHKHTKYIGNNRIGLSVILNEPCINLGGYFFISKFLISLYIYIWRTKLNIWYYRSKA